MRRIFKLMLFLLMVLLISACAYSNKEPDITGYVMEKLNEEGIMVVSKDVQDLSGDDGLSEYYDAVQLDNSPDAVQVGQQVKVWYKGDVEESYPLQAKVGKLEILPPTKIERATMTEPEALQKAIEKQTDMVAVRSITYDPKVSVWNIEFKEIPDGDVFRVEIED